MKSIKGHIVTASYIPQARCIMIRLRDKGGNILKPIALYEENFHFKPEQDIDSELEKTTILLKKYKYPITIEFDETRQK